MDEGREENQEFREAQEVICKCRRIRKFCSRVTQIKWGGGATEMGLVPQILQARDNPSRIQDSKESRLWGEFTDYNWYPVPLQKWMNTKGREKSGAGMRRRRNRKRMCHHWERFPSLGTLKWPTADSHQPRENPQQASARALCTQGKGHQGTEVISEQIS